MSGIFRYVLKQESSLFFKLLKFYKVYTLITDSIWATLNHLYIILLSSVMQDSKFLPFFKNLQSILRLWKTNSGFCVLISNNLENVSHHFLVVTVKTIDTRPLYVDVLLIHSMIFTWLLNRGMNGRGEWGGWMLVA